MPELKHKFQRQILKRVSLTLFFCLICELTFAQTELSIFSATASSSYHSHTVAKSVDQSLSTYWRGVSRGTFAWIRVGFIKRYWWLKLDLGKSYNLTQISIWWHKDRGSTNYDIQASNDNVNWVNLYTGLSSAGGSTNPFQTDYVLSGTYRYLRIYINRAQASYPIIYEVKLSGEIPKVLSISVNPNLWDIGLTEVRRVITMTRQNKITVTNDGTGPETLELKLINPGGWSASNTTGSETYVLSALFCNSNDVPGVDYFSQDAISEDVLTTEFKKATDAIFGYAQSTANGVAVLSGGMRSLYLQFKSPTITNKKEEQNISVIVSCQLP